MIRGSDYPIGPLSGIARVVGNINQSDANKSVPTGDTVLSNNTLGVDANDILQAIAVQKLKMKRATYGTRYVDILKSMGVRVNYQMLQRPEIVARHKTKIAINDVVSTSNTPGNIDDGGLGDLAGYGINGTRMRLKRKSFPEHGTLIGFTVIRPAYMDHQLCSKMDNEPQYEDFYDPALELLPNAEIRAKDIIQDAVVSGGQLDAVVWRS